jgi:hypothetical protein
VGEYNATLVLIFCGSFVLLAFAIAMYFVANLQKRLAALETSFNRVLMKLRIWDSLLYDFSDDVPESQTPYKRHDNVVYLTPPSDD